MLSVIIYYMKTLYESILTHHKIDLNEFLLNAIIETLLKPGEIYYVTLRNYTPGTPRYISANDTDAIRSHLFLDKSGTLSTDILFGDCDDSDMYKYYNYDNFYNTCIRAGVKAIRFTYTPGPGMRSIINIESSNKYPVKDLSIILNTDAQVLRSGNSGGHTKFERVVFESDKNNKWRQTLRIMHSEQHVFEFRSCTFQNMWVCVFNHKDKVKSSQDLCIFNNCVFDKKCRIDNMCCDVHILESLGLIQIDTARNMVLCGDLRNLKVSYKDIVNAVFPGRNKIDGCCLWLGISSKITGITNTFDHIIVTNSNPGSTTFCQRTGKTTDGYNIIVII